MTTQDGIGRTSESRTRDAMRRYPADEPSVGGSPLIVLGGFPYAGKSRLVMELRQRRRRGLHVLRQLTTRSSRLDQSGLPLENERVEYENVTSMTFAKRLLARDFVITDDKFGARYGVTRSEYDRALESSLPIIAFGSALRTFGALRELDMNCVLVFVTPVSLGVDGTFDRAELVDVVRRRSRSRSCPVDQSHFLEYCTAEAAGLGEFPDAIVVLNSDGNIEQAIRQLDEIVFQVGSSRSEIDRCL